MSSSDHKINDCKFHFMCRAYVPVIVFDNSDIYRFSLLSCRQPAQAEAGVRCAGVLIMSRGRRARASASRIDRTRRYTRSRIIAVDQFLRCVTNLCVQYSLQVRASHNLLCFPFVLPGMVSMSGRPMLSCTLRRATCSRLTAR